MIVSIFFLRLPSHFLLVIVTHRRERFARYLVISIAKRSHCERTTRSAFGREDSQMAAKFAVGDRVDQSPRDRFVGIVKAVYMTREGETRYAVDMEGHGTLRLCSEHTIVLHEH
jgi:hypothetical protein